MKKYSPKSQELNLKTATSYMKSLSYETHLMEEKLFPIPEAEGKRTRLLLYCFKSHISRKNEFIRKSVSKEYERKEGMNYHYTSSTDWETKCPRKIKWRRPAQFSLLLRQIYQTTGTWCPETCELSSQLSLSWFHAHKLPSDNLASQDVSLQWENVLVHWKVTFLSVNYSIGILYFILHSPVDLADVNQHA